MGTNQHIPSKAEDQRAVAAYAAGYLAGLITKDPAFSNVLAGVDDAGVVTAELQFVFAGWAVSLGVEAHRPAVT